jgi:hypothetical protein
MLSMISSSSSSIHSSVDSSNDRVVALLSYTVNTLHLLNKSNLAYTSAHAAYDRQ